MTTSESAGLAMLTVRYADDVSLVIRIKPGQRCTEIINMTLYGWMHEWVDELMNGWINAWMNQSMDG